MRGFACQAVAERHHGGHAEAHQGQTRRGGQQIGPEQGQAQTGGDAETAQLEHGRDPEAVHQTVGQQAPRDHGAHAGQVAGADEALARLDHLGEIDGAPVIHGAFRGHAAQGDAAEQGQIEVGTEGTLPAFGGRGADAHFPGHGPGTQAAQRRQRDDEDGGKVGQGRHAQRRHDGADDAARHAAQAPHAVEGSHDAAAVERLHAHGLGIEGDVEHVVGKTEAQQGSGQPVRAAGQG